MDAWWSLSGLAQGLVGGVVALVVLAIRAALEGRAGPSFADLWTAVGVGVAVGIVGALTPRIVEWQVRRAMRRDPGATAGSWAARGSVRAPSPASDPAAPRGGMDRFDRFTDRARKVLTLSQDEAARFNHTYIGTEHLLLGLVREGEGTAAHVLLTLGVDLVKVRTAVEFIIGRGGGSPVSGEVGLTPRAKRVIELSIDESRRLGHGDIGTQHLLLGLLREGEGIAPGVLESLGVTLDAARAEVMRVIEAGEDRG